MKAFVDRAALGDRTGVAGQELPTAAVCRPQNRYNCHGKRGARACVGFPARQKSRLSPHGTVFDLCHCVPGIPSAGLSVGIPLGIQYLRNAIPTLACQARWHRSRSGSATLCHFTTQSGAAFESGGSATDRLTRTAPAAPIVYGPLPSPYDHLISSKPRAASSLYLQGNRHVGADRLDLDRLASRSVNAG